MAVMVAPTVAQQIYTISSGVAGAAAGFNIAGNIEGGEQVPVPPVLLATAISVIGTFGAALIIANAGRQRVVSVQQVRGLQPQLA